MDILKYSRVVFIGSRESWVTWESLKAAAGRGGAASEKTWRTADPCRNIKLQQ
jgi:hypothetical protein